MSFGDGLMRRAGEAVEQAVEREVRALTAAFEDIGGMRVTREAGRVVLAARGLIKRWLSDPLLRFAGRIR